MADWTAYVRARLLLKGLEPVREAEIVEDVAHQLEDAYREALASGLIESEARLRAERHITDWATLAKQLSASPRLKQPAIDALAERADDRAIARGRFTFWSRLGADIRYSVRLMLKTPGFSALAILMLALGTGANAAVFSVVDSVLVRSPFTRAHEIGSILVVAGDGRRSSGIQREVFERVPSLSNVIATVAEYSIGSPVIGGIDQPRRGQLECVPAAMVDVLGAQPQLGRWFSAEENVPGGPPVAVVSDSFWRGALAGDPNVIGRRISLDGDVVTIIGVTRPGFNGALSRRLRDVWVPLGQVPGPQSTYGCRVPGDMVNGFVRLQPGVSFEDASKAADALGPASLKDAKARIAFASLNDQIVGDLRPMFTALMGAVIAVLLVACANVANLGLARLVGRRREFAVRMALGATRFRIVRQTVTEQLVLASVGALIGVGLASLTMDAIVGLLPRGLPYSETVALNGRVLAFSIGVTVLAALCVGLVPALQASSAHPRAGLAEDDRTSTPGGRRVRWTLVVGELALGVMLLVGALLMIRTFFTLQLDEPGFDPSNKVVALVRWPASVPPEERRELIGAVTRDVGQLPGIRAVAHTHPLPISGSLSFIPMLLEGERGEVFTFRISANYPDVMRLPVLRGRGFAESDNSSAEPVALANEAFVNRWLRGKEALGTVVTVGPAVTPTVARRIVGVVADTRFSGGDIRPRPQLYFPIAQDTPSSTFFVVSGTPTSLATLPGAIRPIVSRVLPEQLVDEIDRFETLLGGQVAIPRLGAWLFGVFGGLALVLGAIGLGSTLAWSVAERRREIGVRLALGATPAAIRGLVLRQTVLVSCTAIAIGLVGAVFASRLIESRIYGISRTDVATYVICGAAMLAVAFAAAYLPTRRATRVDPLTSLRADG